MYVNDYHKLINKSTTILSINNTVNNNFHYIQYKISVDGEQQRIRGRGGWYINTRTSQDLIYIYINPYPANTESDKPLPPV